MHDSDHKNQNLSSEPPTKTDNVVTSFPNDLWLQVFSELDQLDYPTFFLISKKHNNLQHICYTVALKKRFNLTLGTIKEYIKNYFGQEIDEDEAESLLLSPKALYTVQDLLARFLAPKIKDPSGNHAYFLKYLNM